MGTLSIENTSGQGSNALVPKEVKGWNWGAFLLTWIWGIGNKVWLALIALIPLCGFVMTIVPEITTSQWEWTSFDVGRAVLVLFLFAGLIMAIVLGIKGSEWAWRNKSWDSIEHFRRTQRTWASWGIGLSVVWLGFWAAIIILNIHPYPYQKEAALTELHNVQTAVTAMMADNNLDTLPNPVGTATNDMSAFPDATSVAGSPSKAKDPNGNSYQAGDKNGYLIYGHDITGNNDNATLVNYIIWHYTQGTYTVNAAGEVTQVTFRYK